MTTKLHCGDCAYCNPNYDMITQRVTMICTESIPPTDIKSTDGICPKFQLEAEAMSMCIKCHREYKTAEGAVISVRGRNISRNIGLCAKCADKLIDTILEDDDD